jgi:hypothetical protein
MFMNPDAELVHPYFNFSTHIILNELQPIRYFFSIVFAFCFATNSTFAQSPADKLLLDANKDSSFYAICKINENEFWMGGENGILLRCDSNAQISRTPLNTEGCTILRMVKKFPYVFIITDSQVIFRYHLQENRLDKFAPKEFKNKCFYDIACLPNGKIYLCGGNKQVARVKKCIPRGFIVETDSSFKQMKTIWRNPFSFAWSLLEKDNELYASVYNGFRSKIMKHNPVHSWEKIYSVKGIAYQLLVANDHVASTGTDKLNFKKNGMSYVQNKKLVFTGTGCFWKCKSYENQHLLISDNGSLLKTDTQFNLTQQLELKKGLPFYDLEKISTQKWIFVGHGKTILCKSLL